MKKLNFTILLGLLCSLSGFTQTTYYWIGGVGPASFTSDNNWNTQLDGSGNSRGVNGSQYTDVLIFDGSNVGGTNPTTGNVFINASSDTMARMIFQNNINLRFGRSSAGSSSISLQGDGSALPDFVINAGCVVTLGDLSNFNVRILLGLPTVPGSVATGSVSGTLFISPLSQTSHTLSYVTSPAAGAMVFEPGGECHVNDSSSITPFNGSVNNSILFKPGASLHYYGGRSPIGSSGTLQFANFEAGSNFYVKGSNANPDGTLIYTGSSWTNQKSLANIFVQNGAIFKADGTIYRIDSVTVDNGASFITHSSGQTPLLGNLVVNGIFGASSGSNGLVMGGHVPQSISGTGSIDIPNFVVANYSDVTLSSTITVSSSSNIVGKINFGTTGRIAGAGSFTARVASTGASGTGSATAGSYQLSFPAPSSINGYAVSGPGLSPNTNVIGFGASANLIYLSKPALSSQAGTYSFTTDTATLQTANANGFAPAAGSVTSVGNKSFQTGVNYIIDAATSNPFGISTTATGSVTLGDLVVNAAITTNYNIRVSGTLTLNAGIFTIRALDTVRILSGNPIAGAPFSSAKYIVSNRTGNNLGVLRMDQLAAATTFPIGTATSYLPVSLTPPTTADFAVSVFEGVTLEGTPGGTAFTAPQKSSVVDAVWNIDRVSGTGITPITLNWTNSLEGSSFATYPNVLIGVARHDGTAWEDGAGTGDNSSNSATNSYDNFSPFIVTRTGTVLPVDIRSVAGLLQGAKATISWNVNSEISIEKYEVEKSTDRISFSRIGFVNAAQRNSYSFTDPANVTAITYYRLKVIGTTGEFKYSEIVVVKPAGQNAISFYPNPVKDVVNISGLKGNSVVRISNISGVVMMQQKTTAQFLNMSVDNLKPGSYVLEVFTDGLRTASNTFVK